MIRKILEVSAWILASILGLGIAAYGIAVAINWRDQEPSKASLRLTAAYRDRPALADADNAFIYLTSFPKDGGQARPEAIEKLVDACQSGPLACNELFATSDDASAEWIAAEGWLLQRYQKFIAHPGWKETVPPDLSTPLPSYGRVVDGQRLLLMNARMLAKKGDHGAVKKLLGEDVRFWRTVLESSDLLITRMIATGALNRHFEWGNLVLREFAPADVALAIPTQWEAPLTDSERSFRRCITGEWLFTSGLLRSLSTTAFWPEVSPGSSEEPSAAEKLVDWLMHPLYQPQDTINVLAAYYSDLATLLDAPLLNYQAALDQAPAATERREQEAARSHALYNIVGKRAFAEGSADFGPYAARVNDIEGVRRAALTAVKLRERKVPASEVAAALETDSLRNPYDERPFAWDGEQGAIVFTGLQPGARGEHRIKY